MDKDRVARYLLDFQEKQFPELILRETKIPETDKIASIVGARRVGKTSLLFTKMKQLVESGVDKQQIMHLNFERPSLAGVSFEELADIISMQWSLFPASAGKRMYLFIDEPQAMDKWELAVRELYDDYDTKVFITGSSSKLLSSEISTSLRGRSLPVTLPTLSFREFLDFKRIDIHLRHVSTKSKAVLEAAFAEFMSFGGFPEVTLEPEEEMRLATLKDYFDLAVYKDIIERHNIRNTKAIKWMIKYAASSVSKELSVHKIYLNMKTQGTRISKDTLYEYLSVLEDAFFLFTVRRFDRSAKKEGLSMPKVYFNDLGFLNLFSVEDYGRKLENAVFLYLFSLVCKKTLSSIHYWKSQDGRREVDFIVAERGEATEAIQVCHSLSDPHTTDREINSLFVCMKELGLKEGTVVTHREEGERKAGDRTIKIIPAWKWMIAAGRTGQNDKPHDRRRERRHKKISGRQRKTA